jgi:molybdate transport system permease protein
VTGLVPHSWLNRLGIPPWVWNPLSVSLHAAFEATIVVAVVGIALGYLLAKGRFPGRGAIETVFSLPMALPPTVVGYYLLTRWEDQDPSAMRRSASSAIRSPSPSPGSSSRRSSNRSPTACASHERRSPASIPASSRPLVPWDCPDGGSRFLVTLPLARRGIVAGVAMAFGRALGDFGATMIVSGSVPMATTMPIALYNAVFYGSHEQAMVLALVQLGVAFAILLGVSRLGKVRPW